MLVDILGHMEGLRTDCNGDFLYEQVIGLINRRSVTLMLMNIHDESEAVSRDVMRDDRSHGAGFAPHRGPSVPPREPNQGQDRLPDLTFPQGQGWTVVA